MIKVVGTMFFDNERLLLDKPRRRPTYQLVAGRIEDWEMPLEAAIRECHEELGDKAIFDETKFIQVMDFDEIGFFRCIHDVLLLYLSFDRIAWAAWRSS